MKSVIGIVSLFVAGSLFTGCQAVPYKPYARNVKVQSRKGGVVALKLNHRDEDRIKAEGIMRRTCATQNFEIVEEGEVVVGTVTNATENKDPGYGSQRVGSLWGMQVSSRGRSASTNTTSTTTQKKEWQIKYACTKVAANEGAKRGIRKM